MREDDKYLDLLEHDDLTGIYNRKGFYNHVSEILLNNQDRDYVICAVNLDKFRLVNDLFGTAQGDDLLIYLAKGLKKIAGPLGVVARLTADAFVMCTERYAGLGMALSGEIRDYLKDYPLSLNIVARCGFYEIVDRKLPVGIMCDRANMAIHEIKGSYEKNYFVYDDNIRKKLLEEQEIINEMKKALDEQQFEVYYQPKVNMESGKVIGSEALVRWIHPDKGMISPGIFIPIFEKNGFVAAVDRYVWEMVCQHLSEWMQKGYSVCPVSINISRIELYNKDLPDFLTGLVGKYNIPIDLLQLEVTESAYTDNPDQLIATIGELKSRGFTILMDDFGSGYSSLNTLKDVPVDILKLDLKFLYNMDHNLKANYILKSVVQMARRLELMVVAEGVETETQADFLKSIGCVRAQGYLYARPMPKAEFEKYLTDPTRISLIDDDVKRGLGNLDDIMSSYHSENETEWYRAALLQMHATLFQYDVENDIITFFDMQMESESAELNRVEYSNFTRILHEGDLIYKEDAELILSFLRSESFDESDIRIRDMGFDKGYRWYRMTGHTIKGADGRVKTIVGALKEVSDEKAEELNLDIFNAFENCENKEFTRITLAQMVKGLAADRVGVYCVKSSRTTELRYAVYDRNKGLIEERNSERLSLLGEEIGEFESDKYGFTRLTASACEKYPDIIKEFFFSNDEQVVMVSMKELGEGYSIVTAYSYCFYRKVLEKKDIRRLSEVNKSFISNLSKYISDYIKRLNSELYSIAYQSSTMHIWEWNVETGLLVRSPNIAALDGYDTMLDDVPDFILKKGLIHPDCVDDFKEVFENLRQGIPDSLMVLYRYSDGIYHWLHLDFKIIFDDDNRVLKAVGVGEDVNQIFKLQRLARQRIHGSAKRDNDNGRYWFLADLKAGLIVDWASRLSKISPNTDYQEMIDVMAERMVLPQDRDGFLERLSNKNLVEMFNKGVHTTSYHFSYRDASGDGAVHVRGVNIDLYQGEDGHIYAFGYLRNIDEKVGREKYVPSGAERIPEYRVYTFDTFKAVVKGIVNIENIDNGVLMIVDMDNFGIIKENFGEKYSVSVIQNVVAVIKAYIPEYAFIGQVFDDRFVIYIPYYSEMREVFKIYASIQKSLNSIFNIGSKSHILTASIGLGYMEFFNRDFEKLYQDTEEEMLQIKNLGV